MFFAVEELDKYMGKEEAGAQQTQAEFESRLRKFYADVLAVCRSQTDVVANVFPNPMQVLKKLFERIFELNVSAHRGAAS